MINETDKLFINSTKEVNPTPKQDKLLGEVPIIEYIDFDSLEWSNFTYLNLEDCTETINTNDYHITVTGNSVDEVIKTFITQLLKKNIVEVSKRLSSGIGQLIFQSRTMVRLSEQPDGNIRLRWRGKLDRIPSEPSKPRESINGHWVAEAAKALEAEQKTRPERIPMANYSAIGVAARLRDNE